MQTYTIHAPMEDGRSLEERALDYQFIKEGFSIWAALFGPFWLLVKGMWLETLGYFLAVIGLALALQLLGLNEEAISAFIWVANFIFALFARDIERLHYERSGFNLIGVVNGKTKDECEARYFRSSDFRVLNSNETDQNNQTQIQTNNNNKEVLET